MLEIVQIVILAMIQGLTEFLPVSSSGHLVLMQSLLGAREGDVFFDVILHLGTLGAVVVVYRGELRRLLRFDRAAMAYIFALAVGTLPAVAVGLTLKDTIESLFSNQLFVTLGLLATAGILLSTRFARRQSVALADPWEPVAPSWQKSLLIGCGQAVAIVPGVSRSGSTIAAALWLSVPRAEAARFSFLLSIPAICGAVVLQLADGVAATPDWGLMGLGAFVAFAVGLLALKWTTLAVVQEHFWKFSFYCASLGLVGAIYLH